MTTGPFQDMEINAWVLIVYTSAAVTAAHYCLRRGIRELRFFCAAPREAGAADNSAVISVRNGLKRAVRS